MKVLFRPSVDEHLRVLERRRSNDEKSSNKSVVSWFYLLTNLVLVPALLIFKDDFLFGFLVFAFNLVFVVLLLPAQQAAFARKYYENNWSDLENHDAEVELTTDGVIWRHNGDEGSYAWKNIRSIQETDLSIVFEARMTSVIAMKSGFKSDEDLEEFRSFANAHMASN